MSKLNDELYKLDKLMDAGRISEKTYAERVNKLMYENSSEYKENVVNKKKNDMADLSGGISKVIVIVGVILIILFNLNHHSEIEVEYINDFTNLPEPVQIACSGDAVMKFEGNTVDLEYLAEYNMCGRVVDVESYFPYSLENEVMPYDFGIAWGSFATDESQLQVEWVSNGDRNLNINFKNQEWLDSQGGYDNLKLMFSNNHLIPSDKEIANKLSQIKIGDYVRIEGYLVESSWYVGKYKRYNPSSLSRDDDGPEAGETIYVTDIKLLK